MTNNIFSKITKKILLFLILILFSILLSSCDGSLSENQSINGFLNSLGLSNNSESSVTEAAPTDNKIVPAPIGETPAASQDGISEMMTETPVPTPSSYLIELWIPPAFDPDQNDSEAGKALENLIDQYMDDHPNVTITHRVKAASGDSSMLNTLTSASHIAQDVLPSLALISRNDMETAVQRGLLQPINTSVLEDGESWYDFAKQSSSIDSVIYGIPVLGDSTVLTYRPSKIGPELGDWNDILTRGLPIGFAPSSSTSLFGLFVYLSLGGKLTNDQGQPYLDQQKLTETLNFFLTGGQNGAFPPSISQLVDQGQVWQRFNEGTIQMIISQLSSFRHYQSPDISVLALPMSNNVTGYPLINTWNLVLIEDNPIYQEETVRFAEYFSDMAVNDKLSAEAGYIPVRRGDHKAWAEDPQREIVEMMSESGLLAPNNQITNKLVPLINNAVLQVIKNQMSPDDAAKEAMSSLN